MNIKSIGVIILLVGFLILYIDQYYRYRDREKPKEKIIYRYLPKSYQDELNEPVFPSDVFETMFSRPDPWILSLNDLDKRKAEKINKYFVSAL
jgi:hypothetical protein